MHLRSLKIFCDVVDTRSFSRAASQNCVSQSNASQVVHQIEKRLGVQLLDRSKRPFVLTPEGERFFEGCRGILRRYDDLEHEVKSLRDAAARRLTVASIYSVGLAHMSRYLREFLAQHPRADVRLEYLHPERVYDVVATGRADLGLVSYPRQSRTLAVTDWRTEPIVLVASPDHRLASTPSSPLSAIDGEPFIALQKGLTLRDEIDRALASRHVEVNISLEFDNIEIIKRAIEIGAGISLLPEPTVDREIAAGTLVKRTLQGERLVRPLGIIHRRDIDLSDLATRFIALLKSHAQASEAAGPVPALNGRPRTRSKTRKRQVVG
jgi:DNA-binding transcriptional LysR family regulator